jgi:LDH2 family malate/lactate/ureidoglycolate dehydrogenase
MADHKPQISKDMLGPETGSQGEFHEVRCNECASCEGKFRVLRPELEAFTARVLQRHKVSADEARTTARVLVSADLRGIASHGVARLGRYVSGLAAGYIRPGVAFEVVEPAAALAVIDAKNGIGQVVSEMAMDLAISKAASQGIGLVTVRNSNHYGIAGYYVLKALEKRMLGVSLTNSAPLVIPTHGAKAMLGTNPIAFGVPTGKHLPFLLDMATSVVPRGKVEVYDRNKQQMPVGWAVDEKGFDCENPATVLKNLVERIGGGLLPLGGRGEEFSGYKGYGLAAMVDILCGVLAGSAFLTDVHNLKRPVAPGEVAAPRVGHFFLAVDVGRFMPIDSFEQSMDRFIEQLKASPRALDQDEIFIHGEKEYRLSQAHERDGIPIADNVMQNLIRIAGECGAEPPKCVAQKAG